MDLKLREKPWWDYLEHDLQELLTQSERLYNEVENWKQEFHDYSFIVFPASKAYEGFLKKIFLEMGLISEADYYGKRFRMGKALNPQVPGVYDKLRDYCDSEELPRHLWDTWTKSRNVLFHFFPDEKNAISYQESGERIAMVVSAIDEMFTACTIKKS